VDVWEHAAVTVAPNPNGTGAVLGGRVQLRVSVPDGGTIILGGIIQGTGSCAAGICTFNTIVQGSNRNEAKLQMLEGVRVDLGSEAVANVRVQRIVIDFTSAG